MAAFRSTLKNKVSSLLFVFLGNLLRKKGALNLALSCYRQARHQAPADPVILHAMGKLYLETWEFHRAVSCFSEAVGLRPEYAAAHNNLALACLRLERFAEAEQHARAALALDPCLVPALNNLGVLFLQQHEADKAAEYFRLALQHNPAYNEARNNLGLVYKAKGELSRAAELFQQIIARDPDYAGAYNNLANVRQEQGRFEEAVANYREALAREPGLAEAHINLAYLLQDKENVVPAMAYYRRLLQINPENSGALIMLGMAAVVLEEWSEAVSYYRKAAALDPENGEAYGGLGSAYALLGRGRETLKNLRKAMELLPARPRIRSGYLFHMHYEPAFSAQEIFAFAQGWAAEVCAKRTRAEAHANDLDPRRTIRIGYVSPDFRKHSVAWFLEPVLAHHGRRNLDIFCYSDVNKPDAVTERLKVLVGEGWRDIFLKSDDRVAEMVRNDRIDILVDLAGHTSKNRLSLFAMRPAPVQVTYLGYPDTTGLGTIDYRLTDQYADPPGLTEQYHTEELVRLAPSFLCYQPPEESPEVGPLPCRQQGFITFGSFNNALKISTQAVQVWSQILVRVPDSRLLLKHYAFCSPATRAFFRRQFGRYGVTAERLLLQDYVPSPQGHLDLYNAVDIALDPLPYNGTTTTCEALWMGVPVITLAGKTHASRVGVSLLSNVGLPECVVSSEEEYIDKAVHLARHPELLAQIRKTLRPRMARSPLLDAAGFVAELERKYRWMWTRWCGAQAGSRKSGALHSAGTLAQHPEA